MGDFGASNSVAVNANDGDPSVWANFKTHCSAPRNNSELIVTESVRSHHPDHHVTTIDMKECDLLQFAEAGLASVQLLNRDNDFLARRKYTAPRSRLVGGEGKLSDKVSFGHYKLQYKDTTLEFYVAEWKNIFERKTRNAYILTPKTEVDAQGHSSTLDGLLLAAGKWTADLHKEIYVFDAGQWTKSPKLWESVQSAEWDDVILDPIMKEALIADVHSFFDSREVYEEYAVPWKRGIIFHGTPGCGKTISIKALMNSLDKRPQPVASLYVKSFDCCDGPQYSIREIFEQARTMAPCLLIFEDLDSLIVKKVRSYFLNEVDGLEDNNGILMIGSTNHLENLDPGISKRPSRFDRKYHYKLPGEQERILYCDYWKKKLERNSNVDFDPEITAVVAKLTEGFSFAYMKELFVQTLLALVGGRGAGMDDAELEEAEGGAAKDTAAAPAAKDADGKTRQMPTVEIPERLRDNTLLRIMRKQLVALWRDMDNSEDGEGKKKKDDEEKDEEEKNEDGEESEEDAGRRDYRIQMALLRANKARQAA